MKNEILKNKICSKEEEIREKEKTLKNLKDNFEHVKSEDFPNKWIKDFIEAYINYKQFEIDTLKEECDRYKKEYNLEEYKMKLSEFKEIILRKFGEKGWEEFKNSTEYLTYNATEKKVLEKIKNNNENIRYINNPTEEMQLEVMKRSNPFYYIQLINIPSKKVLQEAINRADTVHDYKYILKHIENDLNEE